MAIYDDLTVFRRVNNESLLDSKIDLEDDQWLVNSLLTRSEELEYPDNINRFWSIVETKFTDTSLGGNICINPYPQFTRYADIRLQGRRFDRNEVTVNNLTGNYGMGRYYGEAIDDNSVNVYMSFGVPRFNSLLDFMLTSVDYKQSIIASTGRNPIAYNVGNLWGSIAIFVAFPIITSIIWGAQLLKKILIGPGRFTYYYMEEAMPSYWATVNSLVTMFAVELGIVSPNLLEDQSDTKKIGTPVTLDKNDLDFIHKYIPDIVTEDNYIDIFAVITKAQRMYNKQIVEEYRLYKQGASTELDLLGKIVNGPLNKKTPETTEWKKWAKLIDFMGLYGSESDMKNNNENKTTNPNNNPTPTKISMDEKGRYDIPKRKVDEQSWLKKAVEYSMATMSDGAKFLIFRVDNPGTVSESFHNETKDIPLEEALKSISNKVKNITFSLGGGNIAGETDKILGYAQDVIAGALDGLTFGLSNVLTFLTGNANIHLPKMWADSTASLPTYTFKTRLVAPYGNPLSQLFNIYIPLAALLAAALPRSTGPSSYAAPFLCSAYVRGRQHIKLGLITELSITRGVSNLPFNKQGRPMAVDVSFTITDLEKIIAVPTQSSLLSPATLEMNEDDPLVRYIASLTGRSLYNSVYVSNKIKLRLSRLIQDMDKFLSPAYWGVTVGNELQDLAAAIAPNKGVNYKDLFR